MSSCFLYNAPLEAREINNAAVCFKTLSLTRFNPLHLQFKKQHGEDTLLWSPGSPSSYQHRSKAGAGFSEAALGLQAQTVLHYMFLLCPETGTVHMPAGGMLSWRNSSKATLEEGTIRAPVSVKTVKKSLLSLPRGSWAGLSVSGCCF